MDTVDTPQTSTLAAEFSKDRATFTFLITGPTTNKKVANTKEDLQKTWWSQRDSNPCLGLERAPS